MKQRINILNSKLAVSKCSNTLRRNRLINILQETSQKKAALVIAGAGYGKTTLVAQTVEEVRADAVWYCLEESDQDLSTFMAYLVAGIRRKQPNFGTEFTGKSSAPLLSARSREAMLTAFITEIEDHVTGDMIIILDDYYMVQDSPEISTSFEFLLAHTPPSVHFIIISRTEPALRLSRYRARSEVIEIGEDDISFRPEEIEHLYRELLNVEITASDVRQLFEKTRGWAAGLILFYNALGKRSINEQSPLLDMNRSEKLIFQYLEENVFAAQSPETREFMVKSSLLPHLDPKFCDMLFGRHDSRAILNSLFEHHVLTFPCGDDSECFQYHHLLRDFLRDKLGRDFGRDAVLCLHRDIAGLMEKTGDIHGAMHHFLEGMYYDEVCRIMFGLMFQDFVDCPLRLFWDAFEKIPSELIQKNAAVSYLRARLASVKGDIHEAISGLQTALERFRKDGNSAGTTNCLKDLGFHHYLTGNVVAAKKRMEELWGKTHEDPFFSAEVTGYLVLFSAILGKPEEADRYYESFRIPPTVKGEAGKILFRSWMALCYSNRFYFSGDFNRAADLSLRALDAFTRMGMEIFLPLANMQASWISYYGSQPEKGYTYAEKGLSVAQRVGINDDQYAWLLFAKALNTFGKGEPERAVSDAEESFQIFKGHDNYWGQASVYELYSMIYRTKGKLAEAADYARKGLSLVKGLNLAVTEGALALRLAEALADNQDYIGAFSIVDEYRTRLDLSQFHEFQYHLLSARIHTALANSEKAVEEMGAALTVASKNDYGQWILRESPWVVPVLVTCYALGITKEFVAGILKRPNAEISHILLSLKKAKAGDVRRAVDELTADLSTEVIPCLKISCLGKFEVSIGGRKLPQSRLRSAKAMKLFKYLVLKRDQGFIPKEVLIEILWPDEDPDKTNSRFHVAMNSLRKALEPGLKRGIPSSYVLRQGDAYRLDIGSGGSIDFQEFSSELQLAEKSEQKSSDDALTCYLRAESIYGGMLFEEDPYEDCFVTDRELLNDKYLHTLFKVIHLYEQKQAWKECINYAEKYLLVDRYAEPVYCALMRFHSCLGQTSRIFKTFKRCKASITEDLGFQLNESTVALYEKLIGVSGQP